jgi:hypothetical protein
VPCLLARLAPAFCKAAIALCNALGEVESSGLVGLLFLDGVSGSDNGPLSRSGALIGRLAGGPSRSENVVETESRLKLRVEDGAPGRVGGGTPRNSERDGRVGMPTPSETRLDGRES